MKTKIILFSQNYERDVFGLVLYLHQSVKSHAQYCVDPLCTSKKALICQAMDTSNGVLCYLAPGA